MIKMYPVLWNTEITPGAFWYECRKGERRLYVAFPPAPGLKAKYEFHWVRVEGSDAREWDGNDLLPSVQGSWGVDHFHCWVYQGTMVLENPYE